MQLLSLGTYRKLFLSLSISNKLVEVPFAICIEVEKLYGKNRIVA